MNDCAALTGLQQPKGAPPRAYPVRSPECEVGGPISRAGPCKPPQITQRRRSDIERDRKRERIGEPQCSPPGQIGLQQKRTGVVDQNGSFRQIAERRRHLGMSLAEEAGRLLPPNQQIRVYRELQAAVQQPGDGDASSPQT